MATQQEKTIDNGDNTFSKVVAARSVDITGADITTLPPGRAAAAASVPTVLSTEDKAALDAATGSYGTVSAYTVGTAVTAGRAIAIVATVAGNVNLQLTSGSLIVPVAVGLTILPLGVTTVLSASTTATATYYKLTN